MDSPAQPKGASSTARLDSRRERLLERLAGLEDRIAPAALGPGISQVIAGFSAADLEAVDKALDEVLDLERRAVEDVRGRDGRLVARYEYTAARSEDVEASWSHRPAVPQVTRLRVALMSRLYGRDGLRVEGADGLVRAAREGKRFLFISNHESVFDLTVLTHALAAAGLPDLAGRLTFFVNPKIFNMPFIHFFVCKSQAVLKMPQSPRIATQESVMGDEEILRRANAGFREARRRLGEGDSLVIYPEGLRNEGTLHRFARAYLDRLLRPAVLAEVGLASDDVLLMPWAHQGVRTLEDLGPDPEADTGSVRVRFGAPVSPTRFFETLGAHSVGVAGHVAALLVARLLPEGGRGLYGAAPEVFLEHPHFRLRVRQHTLDDVAVAHELAAQL